MVRWHWVIFQCLIFIIVGQEPIALEVGAGAGAGGGCLDIFSLVSVSLFKRLNTEETLGDID